MVGALPIKNSLYILPLSKESEEDFQWIKKEIVALGGDASIFKADSLEGIADDEIIKIFKETRNRDYREISKEIEEVKSELDSIKNEVQVSLEVLKKYQKSLGKIKSCMDEVRKIDFFDASEFKNVYSAYKECLGLLESCHERVERRTGTKKREPSMKITKGELKKQKWITRKNLHVDRLACSWFIKRFINPRARFLFVEEGQEVRGNNLVSFDMFEGEFSHHGEDCSFETFIKKFKLKDKALKQISKIIHDIDFKDKKFNRPETEGVAKLIDGICKSIKDDHKRIEKSKIIFDSLYESLRRRKNEK